jgi:sulfotransferase
MNKKLVYISGLPRSGSTLLSAILNQNPKFQASISGPLARFVRAVIEQSSAQGGYRHQCPPDKRKKIIEGIVENYYDDDNKEVVFDTNRGWSLLTPTLKELDPNFKMIVCVRDINRILDSFEQLVRKNPMSVSSIYSSDEGRDVYTRALTMLSPERTLGFALTGLKQAYCSDEKNHLFILEYDRLAKYPEQTMRALYQFIGESYYSHDFNDVESSYDEFDDDVQLPGLHTTRKKVEYIERPFILPPDLLEQIGRMEFWR